MKHIVVLVPGIHTFRKEAQESMGRLAAQIKAGEPGVTCLIYSKGWIPALAISLPLVGKLVCRHKVTVFQKWLRKQLIALDPTAIPDAVGYSFGSHLVHFSMTGPHGPKAFWNRVAYMGGIISTREDFKGEWGHFKKILNCLSHHDKVVRFARLGRFGQCGFAGFAHADNQWVANLESDLEHEDYQRPSWVWDSVVMFLLALPPGLTEH